MEAAARRLPVVNSSDNICKELELYADGSTVVLLPGKHRWSGRLNIRRLRVFGLPGAIIRGRVQLAEGSSGAFYDVDFTSGDGSAVRVQGASWSFHNCSVECTDQDASAVTVISAQVLLRGCSVRGVDSGLIPKPCWIGVLVKGSAAVRAVSCRVGPCVQRGAVAIDAAELCLSNCHVQGCEEIGLRLDGNASLAADGTELEGGGVALHAGIACTGSLEMRNCRIVNFKALWGGDSRPLDLDLAPRRRLLPSLHDEEWTGVVPVALKVIFTADILSAHCRLSPSASKASSPEAGHRLIWPPQQRHHSPPSI